MCSTSRDPSLPFSLVLLPEVVTEMLPDPTEEEKAEEEEEEEEEGSVREGFSDFLTILRVVLTEEEGEGELLTTARSAVLGGELAKVRSAVLLAMTVPEPEAPAGPSAADGLLTFRMVLWGFVSLIEEDGAGTALVVAVLN